MNNKNKIITIIIIAILFGALLSLYQHLSTGERITEQLSTMRVGYLPVVVNLPLFVALENHYFEKYNLKVEAIEAQSPNQIIDAIISGNLDGAGVLADNILFAAEAQYPGEIKLFQTADETADEYVASILVQNTSEIKSPQDLIGKKIGVYSGLVQVLFLKSIIIGMGYNYSDVTIIEIAPNLQLQGLEAGQYDALSTVEPYVTIAKNKNIGKVLISNPRVKYIQNPFPSVATPISNDFLTTNKKESTAYIKAIDDAIDFIRKKPENAKLYLSKYTPTGEDIALEVTMPKFNKLGEHDLENMQKYADWMLDNKLLKKKIKVDSMFENAETLREK